MATLAIPYETFKIWDVLFPQAPVTSEVQLLKLGTWNGVTFPFDIKWHHMSQLKENLGLM